MLIPDMKNRSMSCRSFLSVCLEAFRRNRVPALVLQAFAGFLLGLYFLVPAARPGFDLLSEAKLRYGFGFSAVSGMIFGGLFSWGVLWRRKRIPEGEVLKQLLFFLIYWGIQGMVVDALYRQQAVWFGESAESAVLLKKVLVDQFPFNLFWGTPNALLFYTWKDQRFSWRATAAELRRVWKLRYASIQVSVWVVWIPAVTMIYSLPSSLQIPLFNLVLCFFTLVLAFVSRES